MSSYKTQTEGERIVLRRKKEVDFCLRGILSISGLQRRLFSHIFGLVSFSCSNLRKVATKRLLAFHQFLDFCNLRAPIERH